MRSYRRSHTFWNRKGNVRSWMIRVYIRDAHVSTIYIFVYRIHQCHTKWVHIYDHRQSWVLTAGAPCSHFIHYITPLVVCCRARSRLFSCRCARGGACASQSIWREGAGRVKAFRRDWHFDASFQRNVARHIYDSVLFTYIMLLCIYFSRPYISHKFKHQRARMQARAPFRAHINRHMYVHFHRVDSARVCNEMHV